LVVAAHLGGQKPLHEAAKVSVSMRPKHEVKVIRHEAIGKHPHRDPFAGAGQEFHEGIVIGVLVKDFGAGIAAIDDVVADPPDRSPCRAWHATSLAETDGFEK
jgi:hypothetical protein